MYFVVDNSIVMSWCFADESDNYADMVLGKLSEAIAVTPSIWPLEVGNVLLVAERKGRISESESNRFLSLLSDLPIEVDQESPNRMFKDVLPLARRFQLSSYDASYLDLAMRRDLPMASLDKGLLRAADRCKVGIVS
jgi:predicted nucleic acid-binding protein